MIKILVVISLLLYSAFSFANYTTVADFCKSMVWDFDQFSQTNANSQTLIKLKQKIKTNLYDLEKDILSVEKRTLDGIDLFQLENCAKVVDGPSWASYLSESFDNCLSSCNDTKLSTKSLKNKDLVEYFQNLCFLSCSSLRYREEAYMAGVEKGLSECAERKKYPSF